MINFIIESTISLIIFFSFYKLFLEGEKTYQFNRFYLLTSILVSFVIPFISIEIVKEIQNIPFPPKITFETTNKNSIALGPKTDYIFVFTLFIYSIITILLLIRFIKNLWHFKTKIISNETIQFKNSKLILVEENTIPYTFLNYIFLNKEAYKKGSINPEFYEHELTHVNQKHTYDILFVELVKIIFWFNPIFIMYKKAIQLNHEFIADENVIKKHHDVSFYQSLLLNTIETKKYYLASNLNYLVTKKRLIMMTKNTSKFPSFIKRVGIIPLFTFMIYFLCTDIVAQEKKKSDSTFPNKELDNYYEDTRIVFKDKKNKVIADKKYTELSEQEKLQVPPPPIPRKIKISEIQFEDFKNQSKYAIWIDGKNVQNLELNKYKASDFVLFQNSHVYKNARSEKFPQENQANLYTEEGYKAVFNTKNKRLGGTIVIRIPEPPKKQ
ncbi:regulatory sensor-transducer, BlaR1/MecR1 family protein [Flavobacterium jejuense]|uniref:Regulatory sensor-transducer, BlaR1/MecR1 family protein n=1 Tax=Flavobacterium jejuense TaxID=1544455 RepID=A0ABX0IX41_9FLAO|nr:M56 family metallopeptidase [Flavobacterium jejuense]NHN26621.1 regulatory sensor-transducer, BlaR1/MecR1 family protein [Flavobacterium jejuense]